jgi:heparosan-N-sulfate-glucuronate 5-epimerase
VNLIPQRPRKASRLDYYRRIFSAYLGSGESQLTFWHERPEMNLNFRPGELGEYYMTFGRKADYSGTFDEPGIPMLDYRGAIGNQYNPIAIAQYGLGNYNLYARTRNPDRRQKFLNTADWLVRELTPNQAGFPVWIHNFDWEYRDILRAPWYSGLAQGQGISLLLRAHRETGKGIYLSCAEKAFRGFLVDVTEGGFTCRDELGNLWIEEYIVSPPTHILNGCLWAVWGVYDYLLITGDAAARSLFESVVETLHNALPAYDTGFWSLYEQSGTRLRMIASPFYHSLHIVQLRVMHKITGEAFFREQADRWETYQSSRLKRSRALIQKAIFKLCYY